jgi:hypothetical protein
MSFQVTCRNPEAVAKTAVKAFSSFGFVVYALLVGPSVVVTIDFVEVNAPRLVVIQPVLAGKGLVTRCTVPLLRLLDFGMTLLVDGTFSLVPARICPCFDSGIISSTSSFYRCFVSCSHCCFLGCNLHRTQTVLFAPDPLCDSDVTAAAIILEGV